MGERLKVSTKIIVKEKDWDDVNQIVRKSDPQYEEKNALIDVVMREIMSDVIHFKGEGREPTVPSIRLYRKNRLSRLSGITFDFKKDFLHYMRIRAPKWSEMTYKNAAATRSAFNEYLDHHNRKWEPDQYNKMQHEEFVNYLLLNRNLLDSTIERHVKCMKGFLRWQYPANNWDFLKYKSFDQEIIFLYEDELKKLIDAPLVGYRDKTRDLFVFLATTGMRYGDSQRFTTDWIDKRTGVIEFYMQKTGDKAIAPLFNASRRVLDKWNGIPPKISAQKFNIYLKVVFKELEFNRPVKNIESRGGNRTITERPFYEAISSHVARKTFITNALYKGIPVQDVMIMSGHHNFQTMKRYIRITNKRVSEISKLWDI
jgi:site-specific recombinase XerD